MTNPATHALETALDRIKRQRKISLILACCFEAVLLVGIALVMDPKDPLHKLVFLCACLVCGVLAFATKFFLDEVNIGIQQILDVLKQSDKI